MCHGVYLHVQLGYISILFNNFQPFWIFLYLYKNAQEFDDTYSLYHNVYWVDLAFWVNPFFIFFLYTNESILNSYSAMKTCQSLERISFTLINAQKQTYKYSYKAYNSREHFCKMEKKTLHCTCITPISFPCGNKRKTTPG